MALAGVDTANMANFSDELTHDPALGGLRGRVHVELFRECGALTQAEVIVEMVDGRILRRRHDSGIPMADLSAQQARLEAKFGGIARPLLDQESGNEVLELVGRLEELPDLSPLAGLLAGHPVCGLRH